MSGYSRFYQTVGLRLANVPLSRDQVLLPLAYLTVLVAVAVAVVIWSVWNGVAIVGCARRGRLASVLGLIIAPVALLVFASSQNSAVPLLEWPMGEAVAATGGIGVVVGLIVGCFAGKRAGLEAGEEASVNDVAKAAMRLATRTVLRTPVVLSLLTGVVIVLLPVAMHAWDTRMTERGEQALEFGYTVDDATGVLTPEGLRPVTLKVVDPDNDPLGICQDTNYFAASIIEPTGDQVWLFVRKVNTVNDERFIIRLPEGAYAVWAEALRSPGDPPWETDACRDRPGDPPGLPTDPIRLDNDEPTP